MADKKDTTQETPAPTPGLDLDKTYTYAGVEYGPGEGVVIEDDHARESISRVVAAERRHAEALAAQQTPPEADPSDKQNADKKAAKPDTAKTQKTEE